MCKSHIINLLSYVAAWLKVTQQSIHLLKELSLIILVERICIVIFTCENIRFKYLTAQGYGTKKTKDYSQ